MRTEIENILEGLPFNFLIDNPNKDFADMIVILDVANYFVNDCMIKRSFVQKGDKYFTFDWCFNILSNETVFIESSTVQKHVIVEYIENQVNYLTTIKNAL